MLQIAKHIVEGYLIHRRLIDIEQSKVPSTSNKVHYKPPVPATHDLQEAPGNFNLQGSICNYKAFGNKRKAASEVWRFLGNLRYHPTNDQQQATTWLELYILFRLQGYGKPVPDNPAKAREKASVQMQLKEFKNSVRGVAQRALYEDDQKKVFKPMRVTADKFSGLAIKGKFQAPSFIAVTDENIRMQMHKHLIQLGHKISGVQVDRFISGQIPLTINVPNLRGRAGWDSRIKAIQQQANSIPVQDTQPADPVQQQCNVFCFACPVCKANEISSNKAFQLQDLDTTCKCKQCKQSSKVRDWSCRCNLRWHLCKIHNSLSSKQATSTPKSKSCAGVKRAVGPFTHDQLVEIDTKRARKRPPNILPPAPNLLSVNLRERFAHLFK